MKIPNAVLHYIRVKSRFLEKTIKTKKKSHPNKRGKKESRKAGKKLS
jgi:hypothetical protein